MYKVTVQINQNNEYWEDVPKVKHIFKEWQDVSIFAYRLVVQMGKEVRVEHKGNGHYYDPSRALNYLSMED